jgi:hypothetical protein
MKCECDLFHAFVERERVTILFKERTDILCNLNYTPDEHKSERILQLSNLNPFSYFTGTGTENSSAVILLF